MSWEQRNADFCNEQTDAQMAYIEAEREVDRLQTENAKLREQMERLVTLLRVDCDIDASWDGLRRFWSIGLTEDGCLMRDRACKAEAENAKLREQLAKARDPQRIGGTADPESFVYAIEQLREFRWQHATNDEEAIPYINNVADAHERENAKLRELAVLNWEWAHSCCGNNCKMQTDGCGYQIDRECNYEREIYDRMRELGIELSDGE